MIITLSALNPQLSDLMPLVYYTNNYTQNGNIDTRKTNFEIFELCIMKHMMIYNENHTPQAGVRQDVRQGVRDPPQVFHIAAL